MSDMERHEQHGLLHEILERRIFQVLGLYLGATWGIIQFVQWLTDRYGLASNLDHIAFVTSLSLVPSIVLLTWFHGKPAAGRGRWTRVERIGIPANLVFTGVLLLLAVRGGEVGAATRTVTVTDEEGQQVERVVPRQEYRRHVVLFGLENRSGDADLDWLEDGIVAATSFDLLQDLFVEADWALMTHPVRAFLRRKGFKGSAGAPLALLRETARDQHIEYFATGSFSGEAGELVVEVVLYETKTGKQVAQHEVRGADPFVVADDLSQLLKRDLEIPEAQIDAAEDLPVRELLTSSPEAYELAIHGVRKYLYEQDPNAGRELIEQALAVDDSFALAHLMRSEVCMWQNDSECARKSIEAAMRSAYRLPESLEFDTKNFYYIVTGDKEKRLGLMRMRADLFPDDVDVHLEMARMYSRNTQWPEAAAAFERALELAPESYDHYHDLAWVYLLNDAPEKAREYYEAYAARFPDEALSYSSLGDFFLRTADYESAKAQYEKGLLLEPNDIALRLDLGDAERYLGQWQSAHARYEEALAASEQPEDRASAHSRLVRYYRSRGRLTKALEHMEQGFQASDAFSTRLNSLIQRLFSCHHYADAGQAEKGWQLLEDVEEELEPPFDRIVTIGYLGMHVALGDVAAAEERLSELESVIEKIGDLMAGLPAKRQDLLGWLLEQKEDFEGALAHYRKSRELNRADRGTLVDILRCQRRLGQLQEARETRQELLRHLPNHPHALYEAALLDVDSGERQKAVEHLEKALAIWAEADPGFEPAQKARAKLEELALTS